jgi:membrane fusion protein, hemolysin D
VSWTAAPATPKPSAAAPAPRALIDYDFESVLAAPPRRRIVLWLMAGLIAAAATALAVAKVDIVVSANGRIVTSESEIVVQPLETSVVRSVAVKMGQKVKAGQMLATLDPTFSGADEAELGAKLRRLDATYDRIAAELAGTVYAPLNPNGDEQTQQDIFRKRRDEYAARIDAADGKIEESKADLAAHKTEAEGLEQQINLAMQAEAIYRTLVARDLASKLKLIDTSERRVEAQSRLDTNLGEQRKLADEIATAQADRDAFIGEWKRKLAEEMAQTRSDRDATVAQLSKAKLRHDLAVLRAPQDATVLEVAARPQGAVIREAEPMIRLVPTGAPLDAEVEIDTRDVARVGLGDPVTIKFEALPWQQYGLAHGVLKTLTPDTIEDNSARETAEDMAAPGLKTQLRQSPIHYRARVVLTETKLRNLPPGFELRSGMRLVADIKIGRRSILQYVLNPLTRVIDESLHEP